MRAPIALIGLLALGLLPAAARAGSATFQQGVAGYGGAVDLTLTDQNVRYSGGVGNTLRDGEQLGCYRTGGKDGYEVRPLLRFDGLALPRGARVIAATLTLTFDNWSRDFVVRGYYLREPWSAASRRLGWQQRDDGHAWAAPGALAPDAAPAFTLSGFTGRGDEVFTVPLDPRVVEGWLRQPAQNGGVLLVNEAADKVTRVYAAEHKDPARRPRLSVTYALPGEAGAAQPFAGPPTVTPQTAAPPAAAPAGAPPAGAPPAATGAPAAPAPQPARTTAEAPRPWQTGALPARAADRPRLLLTGAVLARLRQRAQQRDRAWTALAERCDAYVGGQVEWPEGNDFPGGGNIGEGYQGGDYFDAVLTLGLCHLATPDAARARRYGDKGAELLYKMSEPAGPHAVDPLRDSGYGVRYYGVGMALGYDWLHDALGKDLRRRLWTALDRWLDAYEQKGFGHDHPQGNYFAGYYAAKALAGLATRGESPRGEAHWRDFRDRVHLGMVQPYYEAHLRGGGWPEGWNYGPLATLNMSWPALVAAAAPGGADLLRDPRAPFSFPIEQGAQFLHFCWPSRRTLDDRQIQFEGPNPAAAQPSLFTTQAGTLRLLGDPLAPLFQRYAREVRAAQPGEVQPWVEFLFWDDELPERDYRALPRSFLARGMNTVAMRSSWEQDAVWASFTSGAYVNNPDSGEQYFDQGSLAIVRGGRPLLVNAPAALLRHRPGTEDGKGLGDLIYNEIFHGGSRGIFNVFYVDQPRPYGQAAVPPAQAQTRVGLYEDGGDYVLARGEHLEDMYRRGRRGARTMLGWTRTVLYLRPALFLVEDETEVADPGMDQWLAFHVPERPQRRGERHEVGAGPAFRGAVTPLLPAGARTRVVDLFRRGKVFRLEVRPPALEAATRWLTLLDAAETPAGLAAAQRLSVADGSVTAGQAAGVLLRGGEGRVALFMQGRQGGQDRQGGQAGQVGEVGQGGQGGPVGQSGQVGPDAPGAQGGGPALRYRVPGRPARHLVVGLAPERSYRVTVSQQGGGQEVQVREGPGLKSSAAGVLSFQVKGGAVAPAAQGL